MTLQRSLSDYFPSYIPPRPGRYVFVGMKMVPGCTVINSLIRVTNTSDGTDMRYP